MALQSTRREWFSLVTLAAAARTIAAPSKPERPNILLIYTDDQSHRTLSCYPEAYPWVRTPNIDRLAHQGVRFTAAYNGAWCMPARATLLTGHHPHGVESMRMEGEYPGSVYDPERCPFWPKNLRAHGYTTAQIGKWHTGVDTGFGRDWDFQLVWNRPKYTETSGNYYHNQPITYHGGKTEILTRYSTDQYTDWACEFIRGQGRDRNKPWFLWLCYGAVHGPYTPAERHRQALAGIDLDTPKDIFPPRPGKPEWAQKINQWRKDTNGRPVSGNRRFIDWVRQYHQGVLALDEAVKQLMDTLEETGQRKNTLVVFTSDQGLAFGQHGFRGTKIAAYDANIRSPLIFSMPGRIPENRVSKTPASGVDLAPTLLRFAGMAPPWPMHGRDLTPLLENPDAAWVHPAMVVATGRKFGSDTNQIPEGDEVFQGGVPWYVMIRDRRYKYVRPLVHDLEELYDLEADPEELDNLAVKPEHKARLHQMRAWAIAELRRTQCGFVDRMPPVREV
ncbi:MAG: sulfatase-like hydrolase/transferase [Bryobacteraceae bacterium]|nr:sulfatase-like hydrolase/transferase [Bryobacteraceae bacterium]MDW8380117.1 sulfatase-like hydrolase/transferase [Bryobacterales bacterium]